MLVKFYRWLTAEPEECKSCGEYRVLLDQSNYERKQLLSHIVTLTTPKPQEAVPEVEFKDVIPKNKLWRVRREMLEAEDREKARLLKEVSKNQPDKSDKSETIEELEKELGVENGTR